MSILVLLLAVALASTALLGVMSAVAAALARRHRPVYRHPWPGRMT